MAASTPCGGPESRAGDEGTKGVTELDLDKFIGTITAEGTVVVERTPVEAFAKGVTDSNPVYRNLEAAQAAGFTNVPAPPTYAFVAQNFGAFDELQPPTDADAPDPLATVIGTLMKGGGIILHGEQAFDYHQPLVVGQTLSFKGTVTDIYQKPTGDKTMTFTVVETVYTDEAGEPVVTSTMNLIHRG